MPGTQEEGMGAHRSLSTRLMSPASTLLDVTPIDSNELALAQGNLFTKVTVLETLNVDFQEFLLKRGDIKYRLIL